LAKPSESQRANESVILDDGDQHLGN
jgi:hypothetical protein